MGHHFHGAAVLPEKTRASVIDLAAYQTGTRAAKLERELVLGYAS